jgi:hypothetical protein
VGAAVGVGAALVIGTGGLAAAAIVGGLAAGGAGVGELLSSMSWGPKEVCGMIIRGLQGLWGSRDCVYLFTFDIILPDNQNMSIYHTAPACHRFTPGSISIFS